MGSVSPEHFDMAQKNGVGGVGKQNGVGQKLVEAKKTTSVYMSCYLIILYKNNYVFYRIWLIVATEFKISAALLRHS